jgi:excisionase family DNA binding protein
MADGRHANEAADEPEAAAAPDGGVLLTLQEAAEQLSVSVRTVRRLIAYGYLPGYRVGPRALRVHADDVAAAVRRLPNGYTDVDDALDDDDDADPVGAG